VHKSIWLVNDYRTTIPGTRTLWHDLERWFGARFVGGDYYWLADRVEALHSRMPGEPSLVLRNATWFRPLELACRQVALLQDIVEAEARVMQLEVCRRADLVVFNTARTRSFYPEVSLDKVAVVPLPVDFSLFAPGEGMDGVAPGAICWVGAESQVKGIEVLRELVAAFPQRRFVVVAKDRMTCWAPNVEVFHNLPHAKLVALYNSCSLGLCTSAQESQHLAGLEMGACGLPLLTTQVGAYWGRPDGVWGKAVPAAELARALASMGPAANRQAVRYYWLSQGFDTDSVVAAWRRVIG